MQLALLIVQVIVGIALSGLILLQAKGTGLGRSGNSIAYHSRRGVEKIVFRLTIILSIVFVAVSLAEYFV